MATLLDSTVLDVSRDSVAQSHPVTLNISFIYTFKNHAVPWLLKISQSGNNFSVHRNDIDIRSIAQLVKSKLCLHLLIG